MAIIIGPILFYIPRFFEIETVYKPLSVDDITDNCSSLRPSVPILPILDVPCVDGKCNVQIGNSWRQVLVLSGTYFKISNKNEEAKNFTSTFSDINRTDNGPVGSSSPFLVRFIKDALNHTTKTKDKAKQTRSTPRGNVNITTSMLIQPPKLKIRKVEDISIPNVRRHGHGNLARSEASHKSQHLPSDWGDTKLGILTRKRFEISQVNAKLQLKCILKDMADGLQRVKKVRCMNNGKSNLY